MAAYAVPEMALAIAVGDAQKVFDLISNKKAGPNDVDPDSDMPLVYCATWAVMGAYNHFMRSGGTPEKFPDSALDVLRVLLHFDAATHGETNGMRRPIVDLLMFSEYHCEPLAEFFLENNMSRGETPSAERAAFILSNLLGQKFHRPEIPPRTFDRLEAFGFCFDGPGVEEKILPAVLQLGSALALHRCFERGIMPRVDALLGVKDIIRDIQEKIALLVQHGADVNVTDHTGKTPLMLAAAHAGDERRSFAMTEALLRCGADPARATPAGMTAETYAILNNNNMALGCIRDALNRVGPDGYYAAVDPGAAEP